MKKLSFLLIFLSCIVGSTNAQKRISYIGARYQKNDGFWVSGLYNKKRKEFTLCDGSKPIKVTDGARLKLYANSCSSLTGKYLVQNLSSNLQDYFGVPYPSDINLNNYTINKNCYNELSVLTKYNFL